MVAHGEVNGIQGEFITEPPTQRKPFKPLSVV